MTETCTQVDDVEHRIYKRFEHDVAGVFGEATYDNSQPLFTTNADPDKLWNAYLAGFKDPAVRQHHNCHACRDFIRKYGGLVFLSEDGYQSPAFWDHTKVPDLYRESTRLLQDLVERTKVNGIFAFSENVLGTPVAGGWEHLHVCPSPSMKLRHGWKTPSQFMAERKEDYRQVMTALQEVSLATLKKATKLLSTDSLYRSEKVLGQAEWLVRVIEAKGAALRGKGNNAVWYQVARAPAGFCHPRSSMIWTLLEDLTSRKPMAEVERAFAAKMHPLQYQRPQEAPSEGTVEQAEKVFAKMGLGDALKRRQARFDEVAEFLWKPVQEQPEKKDGSLFGHLRTKDGEPKGPQDLSDVAKRITWEKFASTVLGSAERLELLAPHGGAYCGLTTAEVQEAPPILRWDKEGARNPVAWYLWVRGASSSQFGLVGGSYVEVTGITPLPCHWGGADPAERKAVVLLLKGANDSKKGGGACLFPEMLKAELHGVRSVIEAYSKQAELGRAEGEVACGYLLDQHSGGIVVRVLEDGFFVKYLIDRME